MALWDRRKDEDAVSYARFVAYLRLGPLRSLSQAYTQFTQDLPNAVSGVKRRKAPGSWDRDSVKFQWRRRAALWDVYNLKHYGKRAAVLYVRGLELAAAKVYRALRGGAGPGSDEWPDVMAALKLLGDQLPADTLRGEEDESPGGASGGGEKPVGVGDPPAVGS